MWDKTLYPLNWSSKLWAKLSTLIVWHGKLDYDHWGFCKPILWIRNYTRKVR